MIEQDRPTALYRFYSADRRLLYVGITSNLRERFLAHYDRSEWAPMAALLRTRVQWYPNRPAALRAEAQTIRRERPIYNLRGAQELDRQPVQLQIPICWPESHWRIARQWDWLGHRLGLGLPPSLWVPAQEELERLQRGETA